MDLIILPGNAKEYNEKWLEDSETNYKSLFNKIQTHVFEHWKSNGEFNLESEVSKLALETKNNTDYIILAKSIGVLVVIKAICDKKIFPKKCIFVGSPFEEGIKQYADPESLIKQIDVPILFIQQTNDMFFKFKDLETLLEKNKIRDYKLIEIPGENHAYDNYENIKTWMSEFINSS